jgi:hypothetical protein
MGTVLVPEGGLFTPKYNESTIQSGYGDISTKRPSLMYDDGISGTAEDPAYGIDWNDPKLEFKLFNIGEGWEDWMKIKKENIESPKDHDRRKDCEMFRRDRQS